MRVLSIYILFFLIAVQVNAQQDTSGKATLTLAALYSSNVSYYGQVTNEKLPYVLVNATLRLPVGLYFSAGSYKLLNYGSGISETNLGLGFDHDFNDKLTADVAYTRSFFPANSPLLQASNQNNLNASASYHWPWFKSSLDADYAFGKDKDVFMSLSNSKNIELGSLFNQKNRISIEPSIEVVAGTRHYYETYITEKNNRNRGNGKGNGKPPVSPGNSGQNTSIITYVPSTKFNMLSYNFKLPLTWSRANYLVEINGQFSELGQHTEPDIKREQLFFGLAFYYQF